MSKLTRLILVATAAAFVGGPAQAVTPLTATDSAGSKPGTVAAAASPSAPATTEGAVEPDAVQADPLVLTMLVDTKRLKGEFTPFADVPGGTFKITHGMVDPETGMRSATYVLDPAPKGGDTLTITTTGQLVGELPKSHAEYGRTEWSVIEAEGEYEKLAGSHGIAFFTQDVSWRVVTLIAMEGGVDMPTT